RSMNPPEGVDVTADEWIDLPAAYAVHQKRRVHQDFFPDNLLDPHVGDKATGAGPGKFAMSMAALQSLDPSAQPSHIVIDHCQGLLRIGSRQDSRRSLVARVLCERRQHI